MAMASTDDTKERMRQLQEDTDALLLLWAAQWAAGVAAWDVYAEMGAEAFVAGHTEAAALGRELAGDTADKAAQDAARAEAEWAEQKQYWDGFADDVKAGKYGTPGTDADGDAVGNRGARFTCWFAKTGNYSWADSVADMEGEPPELWWVLDDGAAHCEDCPSIAAASPYTPDTIPTWPGVGVECGFNCRCTVELKNGLSGFPVKVD